MKNTIPSINGLRAVSIVIVIWSHLRNFGLVPQIPYAPWLNIYVDGQIGVNIFFVISGFLITRLLLIEEAENQSASIKKFYIRRVLRIFPAYYFLLLVYFILQLAGCLHITGISWLTALTFSKQINWRHDFETAHLWSLSVEEVFYLFWPFLFIYLKKYRGNIALSLVIIVTILRFFLIKFRVYGMDSFTIFQRGDALMIGCLLAIHYDKILNRLVKTRTTLILALLFIALLLSIALPEMPAHFGPFTTPLAATLFGDIGTISNILIAYIMIILINFKNYSYYFLNNTVINYIGKLSYGIYLWQEYFTKPHPGWGKVPVPVLLLIIFAVANLSYFLIERPFLKYKSKFAP